MVHSISVLLIVVLKTSFLCDYCYGHQITYKEGTSVIKEGLESFTADVLGRIINNTDTNENVVISPISIFSGLGMIGQGAKSETYQEIKNAMHLPKIVSYPMVLFSRQTFKSKSLKFAQRIFINPYAKINNNYQKLLYIFGFPVAKTLDFQGQPKESTKFINDWVSEKTNGKITNLIPPGVINQLTSLVIANALALKASWTKKFNEPRLGKFTISPNNHIDAMIMKSTMCSCKSTAFRNVKNFLKSAQVVTLPFEDKSLLFAMVIPEEAGDFSEFNKRSAYKDMFDTVDRMHPKNEDFTRSFGTCRVTMPTFDIEYNYKSIEDDLKSMGIKSAFIKKDADFSGILNSTESTGVMNNDIYVSDVLHRATFTVNRNGVEAAAATAISFSGRSSYEGFPVAVNKPFIFFVKNVKTGAILFIGKVVKP